MASSRDKAGESSMIPERCLAAAKQVLATRQHRVQLLMQPRHIRKHLKASIDLGAQRVIFVGEGEVVDTAREMVTMKHLDTGDQQVVAVADIPNMLTAEG